MTDDTPGWAIFYTLLILLPLSGLIAQRVSWRQTVRMAFGWVAIFSVIILGFAERNRIAVIGRDLRLALDPESGATSGRTVRIPMAEDGHFWVRAVVNGTSVRFLIDSSATITSLGTATAQRADVVPDDGFAGNVAVPLETANGIVMARRAIIRTLAVGGIQRHDMGVVTAAEFGDTNVLGMSFLSSLTRWGVEGRTLVLVP